MTYNEYFGIDPLFKNVTNNLPNKSLDLTDMKRKISYIVITYNSIC